MRPLRTAELSLGGGREVVGVRLDDFGEEPPEFLNLFVRDAAKHVLFDR